MEELKKIVSKGISGTVEKATGSWLRAETTLLLTMLPGELQEEWLEFKKKVESWLENYQP